MGMQLYLKNTRRTSTFRAKALRRASMDLRWKLRSSPCIFQVVASLSIRCFVTLKHGTFLEATLTTVNVPTFIQLIRLIDVNRLLIMINRLRK